jgi:integrase
VDLEKGILTLPSTKGGGVQYVHLNEEARAILHGFQSWQQSVWVFPSRNPSTHINSDNFYKRVYRAAVKTAGLERVTWHTLRHTFASRLAMEGATQYDIAACLRHSTTGLVKRYAHLSPTHLKGVMEKVSSFGKKVKTVSRPYGTVIGTVTSQAVGEAKSAKVVEIVGAPGRT